MPEEFDVISIVARLFIASLKEDEAVERTRRVRESVAERFEELFSVGDVELH